MAPNCSVLVADPAVTSVKLPQRGIVMAKVQGPLLSISGSGQIGKSQVYSRWKGRPYVRRHVIPANPQSTEQTKTRTVFTLLNDLWRIAPAAFVAPWTAFAQGKVMTNRNAFLQKNVKFLRPQGSAAKDTLLGMFLSPGAKGGLVAAATIVGTGHNVGASIDVPDPMPAGWTCTGIVVAAIPEADPQDDSDIRVLTNTGAGGAAGATVTATIAAPGDGDYAVGAWLIYQRSTNVLDLAYGPAVAEIVTVGA